jgi:hypothetical protein
MKALVFHGQGQKTWETAPDPKIEAATDAIVQITSTTICGTDLHILKGDVPEVLPGSCSPTQAPMTHSRSYSMPSRCSSSRRHERSSSPHDTSRCPTW